jgi:hypothetical protein
VIQWGEISVVMSPNGPNTKYIVHAGVNQPTDHRAEPEPTNPDMAEALDGRDAVTGYICSLCYRLNLTVVTDYNTLSSAHTSMYRALY